MPPIAILIVSDWGSSRDVATGCRRCWNSTEMVVVDHGSPEPIVTRGADPTVHRLPHAYIDPQRRLVWLLRSSVAL